jgi:hypothetical protein
MIALNVRKISKKIKLIIMNDIIENALPSTTSSTDKTKKSLTTTLVSVGASILVLFATVWIVGSAWKKSQKG